jgi:uncharacterized membrane protein YdbT with pleckstrin-like domain
MGRYVDQILQPGETVLYSTNAHWIFYLPAIIAWIVVLVFLILSQMMVTTSLIQLCWGIAAVVAVVALYWTIRAWFRRLTTETDVTDRRVVHKTGFVRRRTFEIALSKIESVDVDQSISGRIFNYGNVTILGVGEGRQTIRTIASPLAFRNAITAR